MDACDWEQEIEDVIEQSAFGETQRANSVYRTWVDFHPRFFCSKWTRANFEISSSPTLRMEDCE